MYNEWKQSQSHNKQYSNKPSAINLKTIYDSAAHDTHTNISISNQLD